jgi:hypothetical protein
MALWQADGMEPASLIAAAVQELSRTRDRVLVGIDGPDTPARQRWVTSSRANLRYRRCG